MATLISLPIYQVNSSVLPGAPFPTPMAFAAASLMVQPVSTPLNNANGALVYSAIRSSATGSTVYYSNLLVSDIVTLANTP